MEGLELPLTLALFIALLDLPRRVPEMVPVALFKTSVRVGVRQRVGEVLGLLLRVGLTVTVGQREEVKVRTSERVTVAASEGVLSFAVAVVVRQRVGLGDLVMVTERLRVTLTVSLLMGVIRVREGLIVDERDTEMDDVKDLRAVMTVAVPLMEVDMHLVTEMELVSFKETSV